jgi:hypothetical protein
MRPYELPQHKYALWHDVGTRLGAMAQSVVASALCAETHRVYASTLKTGEDKILKELAAARGVLLFIE